MDDALCMDIVQRLAQVVTAVLDEELDTVHEASLGRQPAFRLLLLEREDDGKQNHDSDEHPE